MIHLPLSLYASRWSAAGTMLLCLTAAPIAHAGQSCDTKPLSASTLARSMALAAHTAEKLDSTGAQVALIARAGQDLSRWNLHWSHMGWAVRQPNGRWHVVHKLNACGTSVGHLYVQGLGQFFLDDLWRHEALIAIPTESIQKAMLPVLTNPQQSLRMQHAPYSMVSYVWGQRYQQSNQWAIETLASAMAPVHTREQAQSWLKAYGYQPSSMTVRAFERLGARATQAHVAFDDHPPGQRFSNRIDTVTVDSVVQWLVRKEMVQPPQTFTAPLGN